jgi:hypothetical protein
MDRCSSDYSRHVIYILVKGVFGLFEGRGPCGDYLVYCCLVFNVVEWGSVNRMGEFFKNKFREGAILIVSCNIFNVQLIELG